MFPATFPARIVLLALVALAPASGPPSGPPGSTPSTEPPGARQQGGPEDRTREPRRRRPHDAARLAPDEALLLLAPSRQEVSVDETFRLAVAVLGARSLRSFPTTLNYDPQVLELVDVEVGSAWQGGSRPVLLVDESEPGKVTLGISRLGASAGAVQGLGELVELRFRAAGGGETEISLERFALLGAGSTVQSARAQAARVTVR